MPPSHYTVIAAGVRLPGFTSQSPVFAGSLKTGHMAEHAVLYGKQFLGTALLDHSAVREDNDLVRRLHRSHAVGNNQDRLSFQQTRKRALHSGFILDIERRGRLVQQDDGRVLQQCSGNGDPLVFR